ncbi:acyltransferase family protein [Vibrio campbellii]|uniref:acyltransferase family protein n=1 Tax=Vibrio campbellii TaxID=680 RepID=UPI0040570854
MFFKQLHGMRGLASLMVFFAHISAGYNLHVDPLLGHYREVGSIQYYISNIGTFGVEIFFFLSGFVISKSASYESENEFFIRRFFRIYPLFFLCSVIFIVGNYFTQQSPELINLAIIFKALTFTNVFIDSPQLTPNAWSISYEVWYYVCTFYLIGFLFSNYKANRIKIIIATIILSWFLIVKPITVYFILGGLLYFNYGRIIDLLSRVKINYINSFSIFLLFFLVYLVSKGYVFANDDWSVESDTLGYLLPVLLFFLFSLSLVEDSALGRFLSSGFLLFVGGFSYSLYLIHPYTYRIARYIFGDGLFSIGYINYGAYVLFSTALSLMVSFLVTKYFEAPIYQRMTKKRMFT